MHDLNCTQRAFLWALLTFTLGIWPSAQSSADSGEAKNAESTKAKVTGCAPALIWQFDGAVSNDNLGYAVAGAGDVNNDGFADVIVSAPFADPDGKPGAGSAYVLSGQTSTLLWQFDGAAIADQFGHSAAGAGDVNNDGYADLVIGAKLANPGGRMTAGSAYVYSGLTGNPLWQFDGIASNDLLGESVAGAGDVDHDGFGDVIIGALRADSGATVNAGAAYVFSGQTGSLIWMFGGANTDDEFGASVDGAGDVDNDGYADLIVGAPAADPGGLFDAGSAYVYSGQTGALLWQFDGASSGSGLGYSVAGAGDIDGDGQDDIIIGAPFANSSRGTAYVYAGQTGGLLWQVDGSTANDYLGRSVSGAGDIDVDGVPDFIAGAYQADPGGRDAAGSAYLYSGLTGTVIWQFDGDSTGDWLGYAVSGAGDVDNDAIDDVIVGAIGAEPGGLLGAGSAYVYGCADFDGDGVVNTIDNCPFVANPGQEDTDANGIGDACQCECPYQCDFDANGILDPLDLNGLIDALFFAGANPQDPDCPTTRADFDYSGAPDPLDLNALIDYLFFSGVPPVDPCAP